MICTKNDASQTLKVNKIINLLFEIANKKKSELTSFLHTKDLK